MRSKKEILNDARLYLVLDSSVAGFEKLLKVLKKSVDAGVGIIQLRSKEGSAAEILAFCKKAARCVNGKALFIVNDRLDLTLASGADGVHLGQEDLPLVFARKLLGHKTIIGISCQTLAQAQRAERDGADYIGFGSVFKTKTKPERSPMNAKMISLVSAKIKIPVFFIGGITPKNVSQVIEYGAKRIAVTRSICEAKDVGLEAKKFLKRLDFCEGNSMVEW